MHATHRMPARPVPRWLITEPRRPRRVRESPKAAWYVVGAVSVGAFMGQLDASIVTVALPRMGASLGNSVSATQWVSLSYLLVLVCTLIPIGHMADRVGRKLLYVYGFAVFTGASLLCAVAPTLAWLVAARVVQGLGAAMLQANSVALIRDALPPRTLGRAIGAQGAAQALGLAAGPAIGGVLLALGSWRLLFLVNLPAGCIGIVLGWLLLPRSRRLAASAGRHAGSDRLGALLLGVAVGALMLLLSLAQSLDTATVLATATVVLLAGIAFWRREQRAASPLIDLRLLRQAALAIGLGSGLVSYGVMFGALFVLPYYLTALGTGPAVAGAQLTALPVALGLVAPLAGRLSDTHGSRIVSALGMLLAGAGLACVAAAPGELWRVVGLALAGAGLGAFTPANNAAIMGAAPAGRSGVVGGMLNVTRALGTALGIAVTSLLYAAGSGIAGQPAGHVSSSAAAHGLTLALGVWAAVAVCVGAALLLTPRPAPTPALGDLAA